MSIKLVAVDIDGTLITDDRRITDDVFQAVQEAKAQGVHVVIATGRPIAGVVSLLEQLELNHQGNHVITFTGEEVVKELMTYEDYLEIEYLSRKLGIHMHAITKEGIFTANRNIGKYTVHESTLVNMPIFYRTPEEMTGKEIIKIMMVDAPELLDEAIKLIPQNFFDHYTIVKSTPFYLEFMPKTVSKGNAIRHLAEKLGLDMSQTMAIGDAENDRTMLEVVANPVVMENGVPELKKIAKYITKSNNDSGVAHAIREWVLN